MKAEGSFYRFLWAGMLGVMVGCLSLAVAESPPYRGSHVSLSLFCGLVAAVGSVVPRVFERVQGWRCRVTDLVIPSVLVIGLALLGAALPGFAVPIVWAAPLAFLVWMAARSVAADLARIDRTSDGEVAASAVSRVGGLFLQGLILLFFLVTVGSGHLAPVVAALYVVIGLSAVAGLQYDVRRRQWAREGAQVRGRLGRRWLLCALGFIAVVAILAALTPTNVLLGAASTVWHTVGPTLAQPVLSVLGKTSTHYHVVHGGGSGRIHHYGGRGVLPKGSYHGHARPAGSSWAGFVWWIVVLGALAYLGGAYWRRRFHHVPWRVALLGPVLTAWKRLRFVLGWSLEVANIHLPDQLAALLTGSGAAMLGVSRRRFDRLSPRERIALYYVGVLRRARRCGIPCLPRYTPREYVRVLGPKVGDAQANFIRLSDEFVEARYSLHEFSGSQADQARADARRVREALREVQQPRPPTSAASV